MGKWYGMKGLKIIAGFLMYYKDDEVWDGRLYVLTADLVYETKAGKEITVPRGFVTDFATWLKPTGKYSMAAVVHDFLYSIKAGRSYADSIFKEMMMRGGCSRFRINMMYYGVRAFGWYAYYVGGKKRG